MLLKKRKPHRKVFAYLIVLSLLCQVMMVYPLQHSQAVEPGDKFDYVRERYLFLMTGGRDFDPTDPVLAARIALIEAEGQNWWSNMVKEPGRTTLWNDLSNPDSGGHVYNSFIRLKNMALAYATKGSALEGNTELRDDIISGLDWMVANTYSTSRETLPGNWWEWEIGAPQQFLDTIVIMYDDITPDRLESYMEVIYHYSPNVNYFIPGWGETTGANRIWKSTVVALQGVLEKNEARVQEGRAGMDPVFEYVTKGDGFYEDGSFIQHHAVPSNGSYGSELYTLILTMMYTFEGSDWKFSEEHKNILFGWTYDSFIPLVYKGAFMDMVRGRSITRANEFDFRKGHNFTRDLILVAEFAPPEMAKDMKSTAKLLIQENDQWPFFEKNPFIYNLLLGKAIMEDSTIQPKEIEPYSHIFAMMDRAVHIRPDYAFGISMHSERIYNYESINNENKQGWYTGDGMTYLYNGDTSHYAQNFWNTANMYRMPGTTVETSLREDSSGQSETSPNSWVGGSELLGRYSSVGMDLKAYQKTLTAKKSWFLFDNEIVALGAGITSTDNTDIETIVEQRKISSTGDNVFTVNGQLLPSELENGDYGLLNGVRWAHIAGHVENSDIGYYFPDTADIHALREKRSVSNYITMWFNHGKNPTDAKYAYAILPGKSAVEMQSYSENPGFEVLSNTAKIQAVRQDELNITGANFWEPGIVSDIRLYQPGSIMMKEDETAGELTVAVSDPTQKQDKVTVEIRKAGLSVIDRDDRIEIIRLLPTIKFVVDVDEGMGQSFEVKFSYDPEQSPDFMPPDIAEITVTAEKEILKIGETSQLTITGVNEDGTVADLAAATITYESDNEEVLTVNETGLVTAHSSGKANINVTVVKNGITVSGSIELLVPKGDALNIVLTPSDDTFIRGGSYSGDVYTGYTLLNVANNTDPQWLRRAYIKFDLSQINGDITSATLNIVAGPTDDSLTDPEKAVAFQIYGFHSDWDEETFSWNTWEASGKPAYNEDEFIAERDDVYAPDRLYQVDVTNYVKAKKNEGIDKISFAIVQNTKAQLLRVHSKEHADAATRPSLNITAYMYEYPLQSVQLSAPKTELDIAEKVQLTVTGTNMDQNPADLSGAEIVYTSSDPNIVAVDGNGLVTAVSAGTAAVTVSVTVDGVTREDSVTFTVVPGENMVVYSINDTQFSFHGTWNTAYGPAKFKGDDHYSATKDSYYEVRFRGIQASIYTSIAAHCGKMGVSIDGGEEVLVDTYSLNRVDLTKVWTSPILESGEHVLRVRVTGEKNPASSGTTIACDRVDVIAEIGVDAFIEEIVASDDTYVRGGQYAGQNFGAEKQMNVAANVSDEYIREAYFKFNLDEIKGDIVTVSMNVYAAVTDPAGPDKELKVYAVEDDSWDEMTLTWNNKPQYGKDAIASTVVSNTDRIVKLDITDYAKSQFYRYPKDKKVSIAAVQDGNPQLIRIRSKEHQSGACLPVVQVVYTKSYPFIDVQLSAEQNVLAIGETLQLDVKGINENLAPADLTSGEIMFTSSNPEVASVNSLGLVTGLSVGNTTVTVTAEIYGVIKEDSIDISVVSSVLPSIDIVAEDDTFVRGGSYADDNYGNSETLNVANNVDNNWKREAYFKFDLAPVEGYIDSAKLYLYAAVTDPEFKGTRTFDVYAVDDDFWNEDALTWRNKPVLGEHLATAEVTSTDTLIEIDITGYVKAQKSKWDNKISLAVVQDGDPQLLRIRSREHITGNYLPHIKVFYTTDPELDTAQFTAAEDSYVRGGKYAGDNYGSASQLNVANNIDDEWKRHAYFKFDINPVEGFINTAKIYLYAAVTNPEFTGTETFQVYAVDDDWSEDTINWTNKPALGNYITSAELTSQDQMIEVDITDYVRAQYQAGDSVISVAIVQDGNPNLLRIRSKEHSSGQNLPYIKIEYSEIPPVESKKIVAIEDTYVRGGTYANTSYGSEGQLNVANNVDDNWKREALFKFDISSITGYIASAKIYLYASVTDDAFTGTSDFKAYAVDPDLWEEDTLTWTTKPQYGEYITMAYVKVPDKMIELDVTDYVKLQKQAGKDKISVVILQDSKPQLIRIRSKDHVSGQNLPYLDVRYTFVPLEEENKAPVINAIEDKEVKVGESLVFTVEATDAEGDYITLSVMDLPDGAVFDGETGQFSWTPEAEGVYTVTFTATDDRNASSSITVTITVIEEEEENTAPVINAIEDKEVKVGESLVFTVEATDAEGDDITLSVTDLPDGAVFDEETGQFSWIPGEEGIYTVTFTATDDRNASGSISVKITVIKDDQEDEKEQEDEEGDEGDYDDHDDDYEDYSPPPSSQPTPSPVPAPEKTEPVVVVSPGNLKIEVSPDSDGNALVQVNNDDLQRALDNMVNKAFNIEIKPSESGNSIKLSIPAEPLRNAIEQGEINRLTIDTGSAGITINAEQIKSLAGTDNEQIQLSVSIADTSTLPREIQDKVQNHPVIDIKLFAGEKEITEFVSNDAITVEIDYVLQPGEDANAIVVYYIDDAGRFIVQKNARYNEKTGKVVFNPKHFSKFAVAHVDISFRDIDGVSWAKASIKALAAREIVHGVDSSRFLPEENVTRAQFAKMIVEALDFPVEDATCSFNDAEEDGWYYKYIAVAEQLGIVKGRPDGSFGVNEPITRQDISVMTYRAGKLMNAFTSSGENIDFSDAGQISDYAIEAVKHMQSNGIINGYPDGSFAPFDLATRAQAAVIIDRLLKLIYGF